MKILFIGCVESSYVLLEELINNDYNICGVVTKQKSSFNNDFTDLTSLCRQYKIDFIYTDDSNDNETLDFIQRKEPNIIYCFGWSYLLSEDIIRIPNLGVVGYHPAKLPYNKGRHPLIWALVLGLEMTASSFFMIDKKADNGDIISQIDIRIDTKDTARTLYNKVMTSAKKQIIQITDEFIDGRVTYIPQKSNEGNVWRKRNKSDGRIDFRMSPYAIYNLVRGLTRPYAGAHFEYRENDYKVWSAEVVLDLDKIYRNIEPGKVIEVYSDTSFLIKTGNDLIKINESEKCDIKAGDYL